MENFDYPIEISREAMARAGPEILAAFDEAAPSGTLVIPNAAAHVKILHGPLASCEARLIHKGFLPPVSVETGGDYAIATAGYEGHAVTGHAGHARAGTYGTAKTGADGTAVAGAYGDATVGNRGVAVVEDHGTAKSGAHGTSFAGYRGTATAGAYGVALASYEGRAVAENDGVAIAFDGGTVAAGVGGILMLAYLDDVGRHRVATAYVGEDGILPDTPYRLDTSSRPPRFVRVKD